MRALNIFLVSALSILTTAADAGMKHTSGVTVNSGERYANGALTAVRATSNDVEYIDCEMTVFINNSNKKIVCTAKNKDGKKVTCSTNSPNHVEAVKMIGPSSWVEFRWDGSGNCKNIKVRNDSAFIP